MAKVVKPEHIKEFEHLHMIKEDEVYKFAENAALAFKGYELFEWTFNYKYEVEQMKETFATSYRSMKEYAVAFASDEDASGIAVILPPNFKGEPVIPFMLRGGLKIIFTNPPRYFYRLMKYEFHAAKIRKKHTNFKTWYFWNITIKPECQGQGIASKLIRPICEFMDRIGEDIYLETHLEDRVPLYEHYGFEVLEKSKVPGTKDLYLFAMIRRHKEKE